MSDINMVELILLVEKKEAEIAEKDNQLARQDSMIYNLRSEIKSYEQSEQGSKEMNINIKPLNKIIATDGIHAVGFEMYDPKAVEKLEADFKEAIESLFSFTSENAKLLESINVTLMDHQIAEHIHRIEIIEKATNQKWEDIK